MAGTRDRVIGKVREVKGALTGDLAEETKGKAQGMRGTTRQKTAPNRMAASGASDKLAGKAREVKGAATGDLGEEIKGKVQGARGTAKLNARKGDELSSKAQATRGRTLKP